MLPLLEPLSPLTRFDRKRGRPAPERFTAPCSINCSKTTVSWRSPTVTKNVIGKPLPSQRRWSLVLKPPWERPKASRSCTCLRADSAESGSRGPFLPRPHVGAHG